MTTLATEDGLFPEPIDESKLNCQLPSRFLLAFSFSVFQVQGVNFRAYTKAQAKSLGVVGWCANTSRGTVVGEIQGDSDAVNAM